MSFTVSNNVCGAAAMPTVYLDVDLRQAAFNRIAAQVGHGVTGGTSCFTINAQWQVIKINLTQ